MPPYGAEEAYLRYPWDNYNQYMDIAKEGSRQRLAQIKEAGQAQADAIRERGNLTAQAIDKGVAGVERGLEIGRKGREQARAEEAQAQQMAESKQLMEQRAFELGRSQAEEAAIAPYRQQREQLGVQSLEEQIAASKAATKANLAQMGLQGEELRMARARFGRETEEYEFNKAQEDYAAAIAQDARIAQTEMTQLGMNPQQYAQFQQTRLQSGQPAPPSAAQAVTQRLLHAGMTPEQTQRAQYGATGLVARKQLEADTIMMTGEGSTTNARLEKLSDDATKLAALSVEANKYKNARPGTTTAETSKTNTINILRSMGRDTEADAIESGTTVDLEGITSGSSRAINARDQVAAAVRSQLDAIKNGPYGQMQSPLFQRKIQAVETSLQQAQMGTGPGATGGDNVFANVDAGGGGGAGNPFQPAAGGPPFQYDPRFGYSAIPGAGGMVQVPQNIQGGPTPTPGIGYSNMPGGRMIQPPAAMGGGMQPQPQPQATHPRRRLQYRGP